MAGGMSLRPRTALEFYLPVEARKIPSPRHYRALERVNTIADEFRSHLQSTGGYGYALNGSMLEPIDPLPLPSSGDTIDWVEAATPGYMTTGNIHYAGRDKSVRGKDNKGNDVSVLITQPEFTLAVTISGLVGKAPTVTLARRGFSATAAIDDSIINDFHRWVITEGTGRGMLVHELIQNPPAPGH